jgi:uncharacterized protein YbaR (Trm112 family)
LIDPELLQILRCPIHPDGPPFEVREDRLVCTVGNHAFPVIDGIPHLLPEDAQPLEVAQ